MKKYLAVFLTWGFIVTPFYDSAAKTIRLVGQYKHTQPNNSQHSFHFFFSFFVFVTMNEPNQMDDKYNLRPEDGKITASFPIRRSPHPQK